MSQEVQSTLKKGWISRHPIWTVLVSLFSISFIYTTVTTGTSTKSRPAVPTEASRQVQPAAPAKPEDAIATKIGEALPDLRVNGDYTVKGAQLNKEDSGAPKGTQTLTVNVNVDSYLNQEWLVRDTGKIASEAFRQTFASNLPIYDAFVWFTADATDKYGNKSNSAILSYRINKKVFEKINWDNFNTENLCTLLIDESKASLTSAGCDFHANVK